MRTPAQTVAATLFSLLALGGCSTPMLRSSVDVPAHYTAEAAVATATEIAWWDAYGDPTLSALVERAAHANRDVRIAAERVRAARAGETISRSWLLPAIGLNAGTSRSDTDYAGSSQAAMPEIDRASVGLDVSWEIDLSGRLRAGSAAATAQRESIQDEARGVLLLVLADVASNYFTLAGAERQLAAVREISAAQDETRQLVMARRDVGLSSPFDVERANVDAERARAAIPPLETLVAVSRHRIAVLIGEQAADAAAIKPWAGGAVVPRIVPGQPASLLERRPDLRASRAQLEAANWQRREAAAAWFPRLFASALFGRENVDVGATGLGSARFGNVAGLLTAPLFDWGRTKAINTAADARQSEAVLRYEDAIVRALEDVENALVTLRDERQRAEYLASAARSADAALGRAQSLYQRGRIDLLPLLDAQRVQLQARITANDSEIELLRASVRLFKALGGGWEAFEPAAAERDAVADQTAAPAPRNPESRTEDPS